MQWSFLSNLFMSVSLSLSLWFPDLIHDYTAPNNCVKHNRGNPYEVAMSLTMHAMCTPFWFAKVSWYLTWPLPSCGCDGKRDRHGEGRQDENTKRRILWRQTEDSERDGGGQKKSDAGREIKRGGAERGSKKRGEGGKMMCQQWATERCMLGREETFHSSPLPVFPPHSPPPFSRSEKLWLDMWDVKEDCREWASVQRE